MAGGFCMGKYVVFNVCVICVCVRVRVHYDVPVAIHKFFVALLWNLWGTLWDTIAAEINAATSYGKTKPDLHLRRGSGKWWSGSGSS